MKNVSALPQLVTGMIVTVLLAYFLLTSDDLISRLMVVPFFIYSLASFLKNLYVLLGREKEARLLNQVCDLAFFSFWFIFLICWDYVSIKNQDYVSILFSLVFWWFGGIFFKKSYKKK